MTADSFDLAALLGSRICHDLIGPLGAIGNGVELLLMDGRVKGPEMDLIAESVAHANARIRFFRLAFGAARGESSVALPEIRSILTDMTRGGRLAIDWLAPGHPARADAKCAFLAIQCLESAMPWGGRIAVSRDETGWIVEGEATRTKVDPALWGLLSGAAADGPVPPSAVHFVLLAEAAERLSVDQTETRITLRF